MAEIISLVFLGGITDSGKSFFINKLSAEHSVNTWAVNISTYFKKALNGGDEKGPFPLNTYVDWKVEEQKAVDFLCLEIEKRRNDNLKFKTLVINTHFATYSPGGFMMGLDPTSIHNLCKACKVFPVNSNAVRKSAVVLVDVSMGDVLQRREAQWKTKNGGTWPGFSLDHDLEFNRVYAMQYYYALGLIIGYDNVSFHRVPMNWDADEIMKEPNKAPAFLNAFKSFQEVMNKSNILI